MESVVKRSLVWYVVVIVVSIYNLGITSVLLGKFVNIIMVGISSALYIGLLRDYTEWKNLNTDVDDIEVIKANEVID